MNSSFGSIGWSRNNAHTTRTRSFLSSQKSCRKSRWVRGIGEFRGQSNRDGISRWNSGFILVQIDRESYYQLTSSLHSRDIMIVRVIRWVVPRFCLHPYPNVILSVDPKILYFGIRQQRKHCYRGTNYEVILKLCFTRILDCKPRSYTD